MILVLGTVFLKSYCLQAIADVLDCEHPFIPLFGANNKDTFSINYHFVLQVWRDAFTEKQKKPYLKHWFPSCSVDAMQFCPFEDVLGVGHSKGFGSLLIPGKILEPVTILR